MVAVADCMPCLVGCGGVKERYYAPVKRRFQLAIVATSYLHATPGGWCATGSNNRCLHTSLVVTHFNVCVWSPSARDKPAKSHLTFRMCDTIRRCLVYIAVLRCCNQNVSLAQSWHTCDSKWKHHAVMSYHSLFRPRVKPCKVRV
jgi:hypothetical protein